MSDYGRHYRAGPISGGQIAEIGVGAWRCSSSGLLLPSPCLVHTVFRFGPGVRRCRLHKLVAKLSEYGHGEGTCRCKRSVMRGTRSRSPFKLRVCLLARPTPSQQLPGQQQRNEERRAIDWLVTTITILCSLHLVARRFRLGERWRATTPQVAHAEQAIHESQARSRGSHVRASSAAALLS